MSQVIPEGWLEQPIGNIANVIAGGTPKAGNPNNFAMPGSEIAWLTPADLSKYNSKSISYGARDLSQEGYDSSSAKLMPKGALLFSSRAPIGYVVIAENPICTNQGFKSFVFTEQVDSTYAFYYLKSIRDLAESLGSGTTFKELSGATAKTIPFRLAPLAEQKIIADKLDELLAQVESTKARLDAIPATLKSFRQSVLAAAVSGQLTEGWRGENGTLKPASISEIEKLWISRYTALGKKFKSPKVTPIQDELTNLPNSWLWTQIGLVCDVYVGATPSRKNEAFWSGTINWVSSSEVAFCRINETKETITDEGLKGTSTNIHPKGTVMLAMIGQGKTRGQPAILDIEACHNQNTAAIRVLDNHCSSEYLYYFLYERYEETRRVGSGNNQQAMNKTVVQSLAFPLPPIEEQAEIVRRVEELFAFADKVEAQVNVAQTRVNNLTRSILAKAFKGELTAEWRAANPDLISGDNSAKALLERIKAERVKLSIKSKPRKTKTKVEANEG